MTQNGPPGGDSPTIQPVNTADHSTAKSPAARLAPLIPVLLAAIILGATAARTFITAARHRTKRR